MPVSRRHKPLETHTDTTGLLCCNAAAAKFTGSGGAVVVFCPNGDSQAAKLEELYSKEGFVMVKVNIGPALQ